ncbi:MAG: alpha/beta hydrolase, partial [Pseudomonadota bacterium]
MQVIIHGWSDESRSFDNLAAYLKSRGGPVTDLYLGDYISMDDEVTFDDVCSAMDKAWTESQLPTAPRSVDVVVHSTGALVVRHWMTQCHSPATNPIHRFLMLAPANFGSPLAHKGRSFVGRVVKGFKSAKRFQTGAHILKGLELASPFSFHLALRDRFGRQRWYGPGQVLATVIVGTDGYSGISAAANEDGSDGTVRVSTANLNPLLVSMDFSNDPLNPKLKPSRPKGKTAFFRVAGLNHSTVALKDLRVKEADELRQLIDRSLSVEDDDFDAFCAESEAYSDRVRQAQSDKRYTQAYQNTVVHLADSAQSDVTDYFIELFAKRSNNDNASDVDERVTAKLQESVLHKVHTYGDNSSYRSLYFNVDRLNKVLIDQGKDLYIAVTAMPDLSTDSVVGYRTMGYNDIGSIR